MADDVGTSVPDDDFDVTADLAAAFDAAEQDDVSPAADVPAEETSEQAAERVRDEKGRFAAKAEDEPEPVKEVVAEAPVAPVAAPVIDPLAPPADPVKPPPGFSPTAKVVWDKETLSKDEWAAVKNDIAKRNEEVGKGFEKLAEYKPIERFQEMAKQSGTTLDKALENYVGIENDLRRDMVAGVGRICQNQGVHPVALANQILARYGASPQQDGTGDQPQAHQPASVDLSPITRELSELRSYVQQQQSAGVQSEIQRFASNPEHKFFENVKADMGRLMNSGQAESMEDAYEKACWSNKEIRALLIKQQSTVSDPGSKVAAATQARAASKSITGSPIPNASARGPESSIEDEIRQLMDASV